MAASTRVEPGKTWCQVPPLVKRLMDDLTTRPSYVLNLRWDVLAWNDAAARVFGFDRQPAEYRNLLWMLFTDAELCRVMADFPNLPISPIAKCYRARLSWVKAKASG